MTIRTHSPLPWRLEEDVQGCKNIVDVNGEDVFSTPGLADEDMDRGNVELILNSVYQTVIQTQAAILRAVGEALEKKRLYNQFGWPEVSPTEIEALLSGKMPEDWRGK